MTCSPPEPTPGDAARLVIIPSYHAGPRLPATVADVLARWSPVWVVIDGGTDDAAAALARRFGADPRLRVIALPRNGGKGAAVGHAARLAMEAGYTHALVMDADGQHPADHVPAFMAASRAAPDAMILGVPRFGPDAPALRVQGRRITNGLANLATAWVGGGRIGDALFGFRVYPLASLLAAMAESGWMRGFDFDPEAVVRLRWRGVPAVNLSAPVRYWRPDEGGVSHFRYRRDNLILAWMHLRLLSAILPKYWRQKASKSPSSR